MTLKVLANRRILITREGGSAQAMAERVQRYGGEPLIVPVLSFQRKEVESSCLIDVTEQDWMIFTSANGVHFFFEAIQSILDLISQLPKIAVVGRKTEACLNTYHQKATLIPESFTAKALAEMFKAFPAGQKVMVIQGQLAKDTLVTELTSQGHSVKSLIIYKTIPNYPIKSKLSGVLNLFIDVATFTSPSSLDFFLSLSGLEPSDSFFNKVRLACIGPETRDYAHTLGFQDIIMPSIYTTNKLIDAVADYYRELGDL